MSSVSKSRPDRQPPLSPLLADQIWFGGDYNPEQWPEEVWQEDVRLMREAGVNLATVGVFAWSCLEPQPGEYNFGWLDRSLDLLHANGISVCLATATAAPPPWFTRAHPESAPVKADGTVLTYGSRQCYSPASRAYREAAAALAGRIAERYAKHPAVVAWHINNELGCHVAECHGEESTHGFRQWLQDKYGSLDALNAAWGTLFWSQQYADWQEIQTPRQTPYLPNGAQVLDFRRYSSGLLLEIYRAELAAIRRHSSLPATTNLMGFHRPCDGFSWADDLDFISWDAYPEPDDAFGGALGAAFAHDLMRGLKPGHPFLLMEQAVACTNWNACGMTKPPGRMRSLSYQALARGAEGILFFQWRTARYGMEKFLPGMVPHGGRDGSRVWSEICTLGAELRSLAPLLGACHENRVALVVSWSNRWAVEQPGKPQAFDYLREVLACYEAFWRLGIGVDVVSPDADLAAYRVVAAPCLYQLTADQAESLGGFVRQGGHLLTGYFTGIVDDSERVHLGGYPALLQDVLGLEVEEWHALPQGRAWQLSDGYGGATFWAEAIHARTAQTLAHYEDGPLAGRPALLRHSFGSGTSWYFGTRLDQEKFQTYVATILADCGLAAPILTPPGIEQVCRRIGEREVHFVINHLETATTIGLGEHRYGELLTGKELTGDGHELAPAGVWILETVGEK